MKKRIISIVFLLVGGIIGASIAFKVVNKKKKRIQMMSDKHLALFQMMNQWVRIKQECKKLSVFFEKNGYKKIAIYGMSYAGETLIEELRDSSIQVVYGIDQNADRIYAEVDIVKGDDELAEVDAIVVTAITFFDEIKEKLSEKVNCPIISLEDILYEV